HPAFSFVRSEHTRRKRPPTIPSGYRTDDSVFFGTSDYHDAGLVDVRSGPGIASRCGAFEHGTAESRGGRCRGSGRGLSLCSAGRAQGLPLRGRSPLGHLLQSSQVLDSGPLGVTRRALRPADTAFQRFQYFSGASRFCYAISAVAEIDGLTSLSWSFDAAARRARIVQVL